MDVDGNKRVFHRLGGPSNATDKNQKVCFHWRAGKCSRYPCPFLHRELPQPQSNGASSKRHADDMGCFSGRRGGPGGRGPGGRGGFNGGSSNWGRNKVVMKTEKVCDFWVKGNCSFGERCKFLHTWSLGDSFSLLSQLDGHEKVVTGIALPAGCDKLYTGSADQTLRAWDCQSGQCISVINLGGEGGCMISESPWLFVGIPNAVRAFNIQTAAEQTLNGPVGQVYTMLVANGLLFAGTQDGSILAWKYNSANNCFEPATSLRGHTRSVVTMVAASSRLYSGSMDKTIRVWSLENFQCMQTLTDHSNIVMSVVCWDQFLLSCSLDNTIKVWVATEKGGLEVTYTHTEDTGLLTLSGMYDSEAKPVLLCSCNDNTVRFYDLPSFSERGKIFAKQEVRTIQIGPGGLFFTGDGTGQVRVWNWSTDPATAAK